MSIDIQAVLVSHLKWLRGQGGGSRADLSHANLSDADLSHANLSRADLSHADLSRADLSHANLSRADLSHANLSRADLSDADLSHANLSDASLSRADLPKIRDDFFAILAEAREEVTALIEALKSGKVDGSTYTGECACLVGTIANARHTDYRALEGINPNAWRPAERFFLAIRQGDTPTTNPVSAIALQWAEDFLALEEGAS